MVDGSLRGLDGLDEVIYSNNIDGSFRINESIHNYSHKADGLS